MKTWVPAAVIVALAIVFHALFPRYEWRDVRGAPIARIDRWTGRQEIGWYVDRVWVMPPPTPAAAANKNPIDELRELVGDPK